MIVSWSDLPLSVQMHLDDISGYTNTSILTKEWISNLNVCLEPFTATFDFDDDIIYFDSEECYTWFILRWA